MRRVSTVAVVVLVVSVMSAAAFASHDFTDVPDSHPFHDEISSLASAGITTGFNDGTFKPSNNVTRQAMAAFMERGYGRLMLDQWTVDDPGFLDYPGEGLAASVTMHSGASGGGGGYVLLSATGVVAGNSGCPCDILVGIVDDDTDILGLTLVTAQPDIVSHFALQGAATLAADTEKTYTLVLAHGQFGVEGDSVVFGGDLSAVYIPFDETASNTRTYPPLPFPESIDPSQSDWPGRFQVPDLFGSR